MPPTLSRRTAVAAAVSLLALSFVVIAAAAVAPGTISFTNAAYSVAEGAGSASVTLSRSGGTDGAVTAKVTLSGGTAGGGDYRFTPGAVDATFNFNGSGPDNSVSNIIVQPDGKILVGGLFSTYNGAIRSGVARLNPDGSLDTSFTPPISSGAVACLAVQPDGKVLVGGFLSHGSDSSPKTGITRLNADGTTDTSFNPGTGTGTTQVMHVAVQPDGKVIVGGQFTSFNGVPRQGLARLNPDGSLDNTFDVGAGPSGEQDVIHSMLLQPDGKLLVGGSFLGFNGAVRDGIVRLNSDGSVDTTFVPQNSTQRFYVYGLALQPDGKVVAGGGFYDYITFNNTNPTAVTRYNADGSADDTFTDPGLGTLALARFIVPQPDGKLIVGGHRRLTPGGQLTHSLYRLNADGTKDATFNDAGITVHSDSFASAAALQPDGRILVGGHFAHNQSNPSDRRYLYRLDGDIFVNWAAGDAADKTVSLPVINDLLHEEDETVNLTVTPLTGGATPGAVPEAVLTIVDNDPLPSLSVNDITVTEGDGGATSATFTVTRTGLTDRAVTFTVRAVDGTAVAGEDYLPPDNPLSPTQFQIGPGAVSTNVSVSVLGDTIVEPDETFFLDLLTATDATISRARGACEIKNNETSTGVPTVQFNAREFRVQESAGIAAVTVTRSGDTSAPAAVNYTTTLGAGPGAASDRGDFAVTFGTLNFAAGQSSLTFNVFVTDDALVEGDEVFSVALTGATGGAGLGVPGTARVLIIDNDTAPPGANPIDDTTFFVRQHYRDFLNRDPDAPGLAFWTGEIEKCGADAQCREVKRINVSAAFFLSIEFQQTGYFDYLLHKAAFNTGERLARLTFLSDSQQIGRDVVVGAEGWEQKLASNKQEFADAFVKRADFLGAFPQSLTPEQFVDALNDNTGDPLNPAAGGALTKAERDQLAADLTSGAKTRAQVLRAVAENAEFRRRQLSKAFVLMQYFGYVRRAPNAQPDADFSGYNFWLGKLDEFQGNYIKAEMVKAFISSDEYRQRFGQ